MTTLHVPDISEFQKSVDFSQVGPAVIMRVHNGYRADDYFLQRLPEARKYARVRGYYGYCIQSRDAATQGREMASLIGRLEPGEFCVVDLEEGDGDQSARAQAYCAALDAACGGHSWVYSGEAFSHDHLTHVSGRRLWIAAYRSTTPSDGQTLWQHSDNEPHPGIGACDCSIFYGSVDDLYALISPPAPKPQPAAVPAPIYVKDEDMALIVQQPESNAQWIVATDLSSKSPVEDHESLNALEHAGVYHRVVFTAQQLARIPTVEVAQ